MTALEEELYLTPEEYLVWEEQNVTKHEYLDGYVVAMAGAGRDHNVIAMAIYGQLDRQLEGRVCQPFGSDMRLLIRRVDRTFYYYPDAMVDCSGSSENNVEEPTVIFEITSPGTGRADHGDKLLNYLNISSLKVYIIVDQKPFHLEVHRRQEHGGWERSALRGAEDVLELPEIGCRLPLQAIYRRVLSSLPVE